MDIKEIEYAYVPLVKVIRDELIKQIPLKSLTDIEEHKIEIEQYINFCLKVLVEMTHKIVIEQILEELDFALGTPNYKPID